MFRQIGVIHEDHYYPAMLRNLSVTGAMIEGILDVPLGTRFVLDFGDGQFAVATVVRSRDHQQGLEFEGPLTSDGNGGLCTRHRMLQHHLMAAGVPRNADEFFARQASQLATGKISVPCFAVANRTGTIGGG